MTLAPGYALHWRHVQHVMALWRIGEPVDLCRFAYQKRALAHPLLGGSAQECTWEYEVRARIVRGEFLVQKTLCVPAVVTPVDPIFPTDRVATIRGEYRICPHKSILWPYDWLRSEPIQLDVGLVACKECATEYFCRTIPDDTEGLELDHDEEDDPVLEITSWHNFGDGIKFRDYWQHFSTAFLAPRSQSQLGAIFNAWGSQNTEESMTEARCRELTWPEKGTDEAVEDD